MINRVFLGGYLASSIVAVKQPHMCYLFRLYMRGKKEHMGTGECYLANVCVTSPAAMKYLPGEYQRGDYILVEGEIISRRGHGRGNDGDNHWHTFVNAYCLYNLAAFLERDIGDARVRRMEQLAELYGSLLAEEAAAGDGGLDIF
jgi:hypothetical protein